MTISRWRNPKIYGLLGFILVAAPTLLFFFAGMPYTRVTSTEIGSGEYTVTETVWEGAFNPVFLYFVIGAAVAAWGCNRNTALAWVGSLFVLFLSILALFRITSGLIPFFQRRDTARTKTIIRILSQRLHNGYTLLN